MAPSRRSPSGRIRSNPTRRPKRMMCRRWWIGCVRFAVLAIPLSGCATAKRVISETGFSLPYSYRLAPAVAGKVLDSQSDLPIAGARIRTTTLQNYHESLGVTDADGRFSVGPIRLNPLNHFKTIGAEVGPWTWLIQISADGYKPYSQQLQTENEVASWDFGELRLDPE